MASIDNTKLRIDMTPMVDLGFLLISFFIFTTSISSPKATSLQMPADGEPSPMMASHTISVVMGPDRQAWYYEGIWDEAKASKRIIITSLDIKGGLSDLIHQKQLSLGPAKDSLLLQIQPMKTCRYEMVIDALDQAMINDLKKYVIVDAAPGQEQFLTTGYN